MDYNAQDTITQSVLDADARFMASLSPRQYALIRTQDILALTLCEREEYSLLFRAWVAALNEEAS